MTDFIEQAFITFLNMSLTGSYIIIAVMLFRFILKKAPKIFSYCLWLIPGLRLLCKFSFSTVFSIFNIFSVPVEKSSFSGTTANSYVPEDIGLLPVPEISTGINAADSIINPILPEATVTSSVNPMQIVVTVASFLWVIGIVAMAVYGIVSFIKVHKKIEFATKIRDNVYECEKLKSPFVFGFIKPKIYLPSGMNEIQREYVILHENAHIKRLDHIIKIISFAVLALHWYNPLVWLGYSLMIRDMEMSCDEKVLKNMSEDDKKSYGFTLVSVGSNRKFAASAPLSFGENVVEERIVNILKFKKSKIAVIIICIVACIAVAAVCLTNSKTEKDEYADLEKKIEAYVESVEPSRVAGAEIVTFTHDYKAYCWLQDAHFDFSYSSYLIGETEKEIEMFTFRVNEAIESEYFASEDGLVKPVMAEVHFNDEMEVIHIEGIPFEAPVDMGDEVEYTEKIWAKIAENAKEKLDNAYGGKYNIKKAELLNENGKLDNLQAVDFEIVEYLGAPVLVMKTKNSMTVANTVQIPYYRIDSDFNVRRLEEGSAAEGEQLKFNSGKANEKSLYLIEGGSDKEYLCIYELAPYLDKLEKSNTYFIDIVVDTPFNEKVDTSIVFSVKSNRAYNQKPDLTFNKLFKGIYADTTTKIDAPTSGWVTQGYSNAVTYPLSEEDLKAIEKAYNQTAFKQKNKPEHEIHYDEVFCVQIRAKSGIHSIVAVSADTIVTTDYSRKFYETSSEVLCRTIAEIFYQKQKEAVENTTAAPDLPDDYVPHTKPAKNPDDYTNKYNFYTGVNSTQSTAISEAKPYFAISDINAYNTGSLNGIKFLGIKYTAAYIGGPFFLLTITNESNKNYLIKNEMNSSVTNGYVLEKLEGGQWKPYGISSTNLDTDTAKLYQNTFYSVLLPVSEPRNGNYRISLPIYENNNKEGDMTVEFTVTKYMAKEAPAGSKIETATSVIIIPGYSGVEHVISNISKDDIDKLVAYYNEFNVVSAEKPSNPLNCEHVYITDSKGNLHTFSVYSDGTVYQNGTYFKPSNGMNIYQMITYIISK